MDDDVVMVEIPVSRQAAAALRDPRARDRIGRIVSDLVDRTVDTEADDPLAAVFAEIKRDARAAGLTDGEIEAELAAHKAERRF